MRRRTLLVLALCIVILIVFALLVESLLYQQIPNKYEKNIIRNADNQEEQRALTAAESINYQAIFSSERFSGSEPDAYLHPSTYLPYTYANFIDSEVISYYEARYDNQQGKEYPKQIELTYKANITKQSELQIFNSPAPQGATWHNITTVVSTLDSAAQLKYLDRVFYRNQSSYQMAEWGFDFNFSDCYVVEMKLAYSEIYASTAAFFSDVFQIVVLDQNFSPVLLGVQSSKAVA